MTNRYHKMAASRCIKKIVYAPVKQKISVIFYHDSNSKQKVICRNVT